MGASALGTVLRNLRESKEFSLRELAQLAAIDHAYIHRLETGEKDAPSKDTLEKLVRVLKPHRRDIEVLRYVAVHPDINPELVDLTVKDNSVSFEVFLTAANLKFRSSSEITAQELLDRAKKLYEEYEGHK
jgi:transcriptional regulator with XRE-family HTH domain